MGIIVSERAIAAMKIDKKTLAHERLNSRKMTWVTSIFLLQFVVSSVRDVFGG